MGNTTVVPGALSAATAVLCLVGIGVPLSAGATTTTVAEPGPTTASARVAGEAPARQVSGNPAISARGRYVAFDSRAALVRSDTNGVRDVYVRDRSTGTLRRVSVGSDGGQGAGSSYEPAISGNGRYFAFTSRSPLVAGDTNGRPDVYLRDLSSGTTELVSVSTTGKLGNGASYEPAISADGNIVAFTSDASNLAAGDTNAFRDVFVRNLSTGVTDRVSVTSAEAQRGWYANAAAISARGRYVVFTWDDNYRLHLMVRDRLAGTTRRTATASSLAAMSANGRYVAFTRPISLGVGWDPAGEATGKPYNVFVRDRATRATQVVSVSDTERRGNSGSFDATMSASGRVVAFTSIATNLVAGDTNDRADVFVRAGSTGRTIRVSASSEGRQGNGPSREAAISASGRYVAFTSNASNLVDRDPNGPASDVFVRDRRTERTWLVSARGDLAPENLDPAALPRGPAPGVAHLIRDTIHDGNLRVSVPTGSHQGLWTTAKGYVVEDLRGARHRLTFVSRTSNTRVLTRSGSFLGTEVSLDGRRIAWVEELDKQGVRRVVKVADPNTGQILAERRFRVASVVAVNRAWVLVSQRLPSGPRTFWWNYRKDAMSPVYDQAALRADLRQDRIVFDLRTDGDFCNRVALLSEPSRTLWRSCRFYPHEWSPDGARAVATHTYFDAAGTDYWATIDGTTAAPLGRIAGRLDWDAVWEDDGHFLTLAQSDEGKAAIIRCTVRGRCERASRLWNVPLPDPSVYYAPPPVVLSSN